MVAFARYQPKQKHRIPCCKDRIHGAVQEAVFSAEHSGVLNYLIQMIKECSEWKKTIAHGAFQRSEVAEGKERDW